MQVSIEISLYPLKDGYKADIHAFLDSLKAIDGIEVQTNPLSTHLFGDYDLVMTELTQAMKQQQETYGQSLFTLKIIPWDRRTSKFARTDV